VGLTPRGPLPDQASSLHRSGPIRERRCPTPPTGLVRAEAAREARRCPRRSHLSLSGTSPPKLLCALHPPAIPRQLRLGVTGNPLTQTSPSGTITSTWDSRNRLTGITGPSLTASFAYDAFGRRATKTIGDVTTAFRYDGLDVVRESSGGSDVAYLRSLAIDEALVRTDPTTGTFLFADGLGSTVALTDAAGATATEYTYEPYGRTEATGTPSANPFHYTGRENDGTGLYYYRARYYDPTRSRFISEDPLGIDVDLNVYSYVGSSPTNFVDPLGLSRIPYPEMAKTVAASNRSGFSNALILCIAWQESTHDPAAKHGSRTETGLMGVSRDAAREVRYDWTRDVGDNNEANIAAGSAYLRVRVKRAGGNLKQGMRGYGTGPTYPVEKILACEDCLKRMPPDISSGKCPPRQGADPQDCLNKIHK